MKILSIKALNINSLKGETEINFEELTQDSALFAITGPTGSGKSTLLDIISCALYGRTARLKSPNDLMSRHAGEAYCEVEFEIKGHKYRSSWSQKRARKQHEGKFQTAKMELIDLEDDKPLPLKSKEVPKKVEELSGLDFGRFTQSMMLAQGGFDAFLKADEKERSALLEKITGTQIYAQISSAVYQHFSTLQRDMETDKKILESIELLDEEIIKEKEEQLTINLQIKVKTDNELNELSLAVNWLQKLSELTLEKQNHEAEYKEILKLKEENKASFVKRDLANRALNVMSAYISKVQLQETLTKQKSKATELSTALKVLEGKVKSKEQEYTTGTKELEKSHTHFERESQKLKQAREIKTQEEQTIQTITKDVASLTLKENTLKDTQKSLLSLVEKHTQLQEQTKTKEQYLNDNTQDKALLSDLALIAQNIKQYNEETASLTSTQKKLEETEATFISEENKQGTLQKEVDALKVTYAIVETSYNALVQNAMDDTESEEHLNKKLQKTQDLFKTLERYIQLEKQKHEEQKELHTTRLQEKTLLQSQVTLEEYIKGIKAHLQTLKDKKEKEQLLKNYEEDRKKLIENEACFLCGSLEHPYVVEHIQSSVGETEKMIAAQMQELEAKEQELSALIIQVSILQASNETYQFEIEKLGEALSALKEIFTSLSFEIQEDSHLILKEQREELEQQLSTIKQNRLKKDALLKERDTEREQFQIQEKALNTLTFALQKHSSEKEQLTQSLQSTQSKLKGYLQTLQSSFSTFSININVNNLDTDYTKLTKRKELYHDHTEALKTLAESLHKSNAAKVKNETTLQALSNEVDVDKQSMKTLNDNLQTLSSKRVKILNVVDLDSYETQLKEEYKKAQGKEQALKSELNSLQIQEKECLDQKKDLVIKIVEDEEKLKGMMSKLKTLFKDNGFKDEADLKEASLPADERNRLSKFCQELEQKYTQRKALQLQTAQKLEEHKEKALTTKHLEALETVQSLLQQKADALSENIGSIKTELGLNQRNIDKHKERIATLQKKEESFKVWVKLNELVGSADGTKFKKFAQGITLDQLINLANQHLKQLSSRYLLVRSEQKLLELEIIDAYQGNVLRPVSTLSGGESFIVSLALALGLSELASQKIAIDSLFLDEGFGTLDEENLETALNALNLLQSAGKMIGVISHVEALKERIPLQIKVVPNGDGTSIVEL
ncbi:MAG: lantibiotic ABC transporter [Sulfurovum sp.]|nr:MAG: lantibiotic ABC transporter [Sulfurovum sp.]